MRQRKPNKNRQHAFCPLTDDGPESPDSSRTRPTRFFNSDVDAYSEPILSSEAYAKYKQKVGTGGKLLEHEFDTKYLGIAKDKGRIPRKVIGRLGNGTKLMTSASTNKTQESSGVFTLHRTM